MKNNQIQKNIPDGWQVTKLAGIFEFKNGLNKEKEFFGHGTPIVNYMDVNRGGGLYKENILGKVEVNQSEQSRFNVKRGDVFFTRTSETLNEIGFSAVAIDKFEDTVFSGFVLRARPKVKVLTPEYSQYCFRAQSARKEIMEKSSYTTRALTSGTLLNHVRISLPPLPEQKRIVVVLETWDKAIEKLTQKIEIKKQIKKGLMQDLLTGKKRLPGFSDDWRVEKLGDISIIKKGESITKKDITTGNVPVIAGGQQPAYYHNKSNRTGTTITVSASGAYAGYIDVYSIPIFVSDCTSIQEKNVDINFIYFYLKLKQCYIYSLQTGGAQPHVQPKDLQSIKIPIPKLQEEQRAIGEILSIADKEIEGLEKKLSFFKDQKKYLLDNLITGAIRTPENMKITT